MLIVIAKNDIFFFFTGRPFLTFNDLIKLNFFLFPGVLVGRQPQEGHLQLDQGEPPGDRREPRQEVHLLAGLRTVPDDRQGPPRRNPQGHDCKEQGF